ncbi:hypothetical protein T439DRAFT_177060 [Meredithblackwellia eburnea MCA 4105]
MIRKMLVLVGAVLFEALAQAAQTPTTANYSFWFQTQDDGNKMIPQCASWKFTTLDNPGAVTSPSPPYYLQVAPENGLVITQEITNSIGGSGNWTANYPVGTNMILAMIDADGNTGGSVGNYSIVTGSTGCTTALKATSLSFTTNPASNPCDAMNLTITAGTAPFV